MTAPLPFKIHAAQDAAVSPVVFSNPHSGRALPDHFRFDVSRELLDRYSDPFIDLLVSGVPATGTPVLEAQIHRACIDLNRFEFELDPAKIKDPWPHPGTITDRVKFGIGLIPALVADSNGRYHNIFNYAARPDSAEIMRRIENYHRPFYATLHELTGAARAAHGFSIHADIHSMPRLTPRHDVIISTLKGKTCHPRLQDMAQSFFAGFGLRTRVNEIFYGGPLVEATGDPATGRHSLQVEFARDLYMDNVPYDYNPEQTENLKYILTSFAEALNVFAADHAALLMPPDSNTSPQQARSALSSAAMSAPAPRSARDVTP